MKQEKIEHLLEKYYEGQSSLQEESMLMDFFNSTNNLGELESHRVEFLYWLNFKNESTKKDFSIQEEKKEHRFNSGLKIQNFNRQLLRIAASILLLFGVFGLGRWSKSLTEKQTEYTLLKEEVNSLKVMVIDALIDKQQANDRIQAINMAENLGGALPEYVIDLLIQSIREDVNPNVRLASLSTLQKYKDSTRIQLALLESLKSQNSPLIQMKLLQALKEVQLVEKKNILQEFINQAELDTDIRNFVQEILNQPI